MRYLSTGPLLIATCTCCAESSGSVTAAAHIPVALVQVALSGIMHISSPTGVICCTCINDLREADICLDIMQYSAPVFI